MNTNQQIARGIIIIGTFILGALMGYLSQSPREKIPLTKEVIETQAAVELEKINTIHRNNMEYQEAKNREPIRPLTEEQLDAQSVSVGEYVGLKLLFGN